MTPAPRFCGHRDPVSVPAPTRPIRPAFDKREARRLAAGLAFAILGLAPCGRAHAQIGVSVSLESDYRFRGPSLTDHRPALSLNLSYDHPSGAYAGASAMVTDTRYQGVEALGFMEYAGVVKRVNDDVAVDVGLSNVNLKRYNADRKSELNYTEVYAGLVGKILNLHGYFSPNYVRSGIQTVYLDLGGVIHPWDKWRLFGHVGLFAPANDAATAFGIRRRFDARAGVAREFKNSELHLVWTTYGPQTLRPGVTPPKRSGVVLGATYFF
ncbi:MAG: TorF family putative porin [Caulobacteraceae bacterium]